MRSVAGCVTQGNFSMITFGAEMSPCVKANLHGTIFAYDCRVRFL